MQIKLPINVNFKLIGKIIYSVVFCMLFIVAAFVLVSGLNIPGGFKLFTVQSGSMEPAISVGSIVVVKPTDNYLVGDVITATALTDPKATVTHRIVGVNNLNGTSSFTTRGDANNAIDTDNRPLDTVIGKVVFTFPLIGYLISFSKTKEGLLLLVLIPAIIIIFSELITIRDEVKKIRSGQKFSKTKFIANIKTKLNFLKRKLNEKFNR